MMVRVLGDARFMTTRTFLYAVRFPPARPRLMTAGADLSGEKGNRVGRARRAATQRDALQVAPLHKAIGFYVYLFWK